MRIVSVISLLIALAIPASAATPVHKWSTVFPGNHGSYCGSMAIDGAGNAFVGMSFGDSICVGPDTLVAIPGPADEGGNDILLTKIAEDGHPVWSLHFGNENRETIDKLDCDDAGNVVIAGRFRGTIDFGGGPLTSLGSGDDLYVACFDNNGNHSWSRRFGNVGGEWADGVTFDGDGNVVFCGQANGTIDFGDGPMTGTPYLLFVLKLDGSGTLMWSRGYPGYSGIHFDNVTCDAAGSVVGVGRFKGSIDFGGGVLNAPGDIDIFLLKLDANGGYLFASQFGDLKEQWASDVACDASGNIFMSGSFDGTINFGGSDMTAADDGNSFTSDADGFVVKFDDNGSFLWQRAFMGASSQAVEDIVLDGLGNVVLSGRINNEIDFGDGPVPFYGYFLAAVDVSGSNLWHVLTKAGVADVASAPGGTIWSSGSYQGYVQMGSEVLPWGNYDGYVATWANPQATAASEFTPAASRVSGNFPNPFNPSTTISFVLGSKQHAMLGIYDAAGRRVRMLDRGELGAGAYTTHWDGRDDAGRAVASGVYFCRLEGAPGSGTQKMLLLK